MKAAQRWRFPVLMAVLSALGGCAVMPDWPELFAREEPVAVAEVRRTLACGSTVDSTTLAVFNSPAAFTGWSENRGVAFYGQAEMPPGRYLLIEMGRRASQGYGLAVSRNAGYRNQQLVVHVTFLAPPEGAAPEGEAVSPCSLVRLPTLDGLSDIRIVDQTGQTRATLSLGVGA